MVTAKKIVKENHSDEAAAIRAVNLFDDVTMAQLHVKKSSKTGADHKLL